VKNRLLILLITIFILTIFFSFKEDLFFYVGKKFYDSNNIELAQRFFEASESIHGFNLLLDYAVINDDKVLGERALSLGATADRVIIGEVPLIYIAVKRGNDKIVKILLKYGANINRNPTNKPLFLIAHEKSEPQVIKALLGAGADIDLLDSKGKPVIYELVAKESYESVKILGDAGANLIYTSPDDKTMLDLAYENDDKRLISYFIRRGLHANKHKVITTRLHAAIEDGDARKIKILLAEGEDPYLMDKYGTTPLVRAVMSKSSDLVETLLVNGVDPNINQGEALRTAIYDDYGEIVEMLIDSGSSQRSPEILQHPWIFLEAVCKPVSLVKTLVQNGANVNLSDDRNRTTPLAEAAKCGNWKAVEYLLSKKATLKGESTLQNSSSDLHRASYLGDEKRVKSLLRSGLSVNKQDQFGYTPLHFAAAGGHGSVIQLLLDNGALINFEGAKAETPIFFAAEHADRDTCELLVKFGAKIHHKNIAGFSLTYMAARGNNVEVFEWLLSEGFDAAPLNDNYPPISVAATHGAIDIVELLISKGIDLNGKKNWSPLQRAIVYDNQEIAYMLLSHGAEIPPVFRKKELIPAMIKDMTGLTDIEREKRRRLIAEYDLDILKNIGFDCLEAKTLVERIICSGSPDLRSLDKQMSQFYFHLYENQKYSQSQQRIKKDQLEWLSLRAKTCISGLDPANSKRDFWKSVMCLEMEYEKRINRFLELEIDNHVYY